MKAVYQMPNNNNLRSRSLVLLSQLSCCHSAIWWGIQLWGWPTESHLIPPPSLHGWEGSSFPGLIPPDDMFDSKAVVGMTPGDSGVVSGYQVDEFTLSWFIKHFVAQSHIYPGFMAKITHL